MLRNDEYHIKMTTTFSENDIVTLLQPKPYDFRNKHSQHLRYRIPGSTMFIGNSEYEVSGSRYMCETIYIETKNYEKENFVTRVLADIVWNLGGDLMRMPLYLSSLGIDDGIQNHCFEVRKVNAMVEKVLNFKKDEFLCNLSGMHQYFCFSF